MVDRRYLSVFGTWREVEQRPVLWLGQEGIEDSTGEAVVADPRPRRTAGASNPPPRRTAWADSTP